ncbi:50S ribosomal protein L18 [Candidatus Peribacteria bacterium]|nr:50S ribosomal protein L18 [Candidatus Peribacteria bacterium]
MSVSTKQQRYIGRKRRTNVMARKAGVASGLPRLIIFKSNKGVYAHLMDDEQGKMLCGVSGLKLTGTGTERAHAVGKAIAEKAKAAGVPQVVFDRNGYRFTGQVAAVAAGAREGGLSC